MTTTFYLIRHGEYLRKAHAVSEADADHGLSERGREQAHRLRTRLETSDEIRADALVCSTLPRAKQTADILAPVWALSPVAMPGLCEWESGNEALGEEAFIREWNRLDASARRHHRFRTGCETIVEFTARVHAALHALEGQHHDQSVVVVAHGGVIEAAFAYFLGQGRETFRGGYPAAGHTSITCWRRGNLQAEWVQEFANDCHHLR